NYLSLFLYIRQCNETQNIFTFHETEYGNNGFLFLDNIQNSQFNNNLYKNAILYTGDGELKKQSDLQSLVSALGQDRIERIFAFQVPHHGAKGNSYKGLAADLKPNMSIFSAGENSKYKHPHPIVFFDFKNHTPIFVNENNTLTFSFS
ncbi:hypothetical protein ACLS0J_09170, partial [Avibacterium avium]